MGRMGRRARRDRDPLQFLLNELRRNAKKRGAEFSLTKEDLLPIPTHCPVLGIELNYLAGSGGGPNSASIDRTDPQLGYVPGNVVIMSRRANTLKNDASCEELRKVLEYTEKISKPLVKRSMSNSN